MFCVVNIRTISVKTVNLYVDTIYIGLKQKKFLEFFFCIGKHSPFLFGGLLVVFSLLHEIIIFT